jgi:hypothetical protein
MRARPVAVVTGDQAAGRARRDAARKQIAASDGPKTLFAQFWPVEEGEAEFRSPKIRAAARPPGA